MFALDRVWVRPRGSLLQFTVHRSKLSRRASDHYPVKAVVAPEAVTAARAETRMIFLLKNAWTLVYESVE